MVSQRSDPNRFFTGEEKKRIIQAIQHAEKRTSGEVRVYLERKTKGEPMTRAKKVFENLGMTRTEKRNSVLVYFSLASHEFAILGDRGINEKVGEGFWKDVTGKVEDAFLQGDFVGGLEKGIHLMGEKLSVYFPRARRDINELPDEIQE